MCGRITLVVNGNVNRDSGNGKLSILLNFDKGEKTMRQAVHF